MIVEINHLCARWLGRTPADLSGQQFTTLLAPGDQSVTLPLSTSDRQQVIELALQCVDGTTVPVDAYARPLPYNGRLLELITVHNISIRKHT
jgi:PAS domain S-box-containing protein